MPTAQTPPPQHAPQTAMRLQPPIAPAIGQENNCPKCGASIDPELGRCTGCGLLYGGRHRAMQRAAPATPAARPPLTPRPQSPAAQQPPAAYGSGQHPNYSPPGAMPQVGIPIPRAVPVAASAARMPASPPMPASLYPQQALPPPPVEPGISATKKRGFPGFITALFIIIVLVFVGGGIYYFINQAETPLPPNNGITDITPLSIQSGPTTSSITESSATITWATNEDATSQVEYGKTKTYDSAMPENTDLSTSHSIELTELDPGTTYYFKVTSIDAAGNKITAEGKLTTLATADETPPTISGVGVSNITESSATITWATNEDATSQVEYGKTETYGSEKTGTNLTSNHNVTLNGLSDNTTYYFKVISKDASGNEATLAAENQKFTTEAVIPVGYEIGNRAPEFTLNGLNGNEKNLSDFQGNIVIVNFWATWCEPCMDELPLFQAISDNWTGENLEILAINYKETENQVRSELADKGYTFTVLLDSDGEVSELYGITPTTYIPRTFFIDAEGIIREIQEESFGSQAEIEDILDSL